MTGFHRPRTKHHPFIPVGAVLVIGLLLAACPTRNAPPLTGSVVIVDRDGMPTHEPEPGAVLTADTSALGGHGEISFQWRRGNANISPRATLDDSEAPSNPHNGVYILQDDDAGYTITVVVSRSGNSGAIMSLPTSPVLGVPPYSVSVTPRNVAASVMQGETATLASLFYVVVKAKNGTSVGVRQTVDWHIENGHERGSIIGGALEVNDDAPIDSQIIVRARARNTDIYSDNATITVSPAPRNVAITPHGTYDNPLQMERGATKTFTATVTRDDGLIDGVPQEVTWAVTPRIGVSMLDGVLRVEPTVPNGAELTVTAMAVNGVEGASFVIVVYAPATSISIGSHPAEVIRGRSLQFSATVLPLAASQSVIWGIASAGIGAFMPEIPGVASIDAEGQLTVETSAPADKIIYVRAMTTCNLRYDITTVTVIDEFRYGISLSITATHDFGSVNVGYSAVTPLTVTVTNIGTRPTGNLALALSSIGEFALSRIEIPSIPVDDHATFTVGPRQGLAAGTHSATVMVYSPNPNLENQGFDVRFTVLPTYDCEHCNDPGCSGCHGNITIEIGGIEVEADAVPHFSVLDTPAPVVTVANAGQFDSGTLRWFIGNSAIPINTGPSLALDYSVHGNRIGRHYIAVEGTVNGVPFSRRIAFTVTM